MEGTVKRKAYLTAVLKKGPVILAALAVMAGAIVMTEGAAMALAEADCRSCHGTGTTLSTVALHHALVQAKGLTCQRCHQQIPDGTGGYTISIVHDCLVCHINATHDAVHNLITRPADCAQCHTLSTVDEHTTRGSTCGTCHDSTVAAVQKAISDGRAGLPVSCLSCHSVISGHPHPYFFTSAECSTCHTLGPVEEHTSRGSTCAACHSSAKAEVVNAIKVGKTGVKVYCENCHGAGFIHPEAHVKTYSPYADCSTCHTGTLPNLHQAKGYACAACHSSTASAAVKAAVSSSAAGGTIYCANCHTSFGNHAVQHDKVALPTETDFISIHEQSKPASYCFGCHTTTVAARSKAIDDGMKGVTIACTACHPSMIPANIPPTASAGPDVTGYTNQAVTFSGTASTDPDGTIATYHWNFGDGTSTLNGATVSHIYTTAGSYWVTLTVTDNDGATATDTAIVTIQQGVSYTPVSEALAITRLSSATTSDSSGSRTTVTSQFKDNNLTTGYAVSYSSRSGYTAVAMRVTRDALTTSKVILRFYVSSISGTQSARIYPYRSDAAGIDSTSSASYSITGTGWKELDVTSLASKMNGFGWMKFRITTTGSFRVSEGNFTIQ